MSSAIAVQSRKSLGSVLRQILLARFPVLPRTSLRLPERLDATDGDESPLSQVQHEISAIRAYAQFMCLQGDMPADHRERFLSRIIGSCDDALARLAARRP